MSDTSRIVGGPLIRYGGKGRNAPAIVPHFARARLYLEPFFGAGSIFFRLPATQYEREAVNDLDHSLMTFFRMLRDRTDDLVRVCELTPFAREEFRLALERSDDELEEARRVWIRSRQGFAGKANVVGDWGRSNGVTAGEFHSHQTQHKVDALRLYARRLARAQIDCIDGVDFIAKWTSMSDRDVFVYCDPPYVASARKGDVYEHEMDDVAHERLAAEVSRAVERGARVAISGYPSALYDGLYAGWRRVEFDVALFGALNTTAEDRRTECLWCSYPESDEAGASARQLTLVSR